MIEAFNDAGSSGLALPVIHPPQDCAIPMMSRRRSSACDCTPRVDPAKKVARGKARPFFVPCKLNCSDGPSSCPTPACPPRTRPRRVVQPVPGMVPAFDWRVSSPSPEAKRLSCQPLARGLGGLIEVYRTWSRSPSVPMPPEHAVQAVASATHQVRGCIVRGGARKGTSSVACASVPYLSCRKRTREAATLPDRRWI